MEEHKKNQIGEYLFTDKHTYELAKLELEKINKLKQSIGTEAPENIRKVYEGLTKKLFFSTPIGVGFLSDMRKYLVEIYGDSEIAPIPVPSGRVVKGTRGKTVDAERYKKLKTESERIKQLKNKLVIAVVALCVMVIGMLFIAITNENVGYFRTEEKIVNKYAAWEERLYNWEQELNEREASISHF